MKNLHDYLLEHSSKYKNWHNNSNYQKVHWLAFIVVAVLFTTGSLINIQKYVVVQGEQNLAAADASNINDLENLTRQMFKAIKVYKSASEQDRQAAVDQLTAIVVARRDVMLKKAKNDPEGFLLAALPPGLLNQLPDEISALFETETEAEGVLTVSIAEDMKTGLKETSYELLNKTNDKKYELHFAKGQPELLTGSIVKAKGTSLNNQLVLASADSSGGLIVTSAMTAGPTGEQRVLAMLVNFTNSTSQPWTPAQVASQLFPPTNSTNAYYVENSFNKTYFNGDVTNWITIPYDNTGDCNTMSSTWANAADQAAVAMGYNLSNYNRLVYVMVKGTNCNWAGWSNIGGNPSRTWTYGYNDARLFDHELGHAIGMWHASSYSCGAKSIDVSTNCTMSEYGDVYDTMGSWNIFHLNSAHKVQQTYIPTANVQTITASSGVYAIYPIESVSSNVQVLKLYKPDTRDYYYLEYRQPIGFDNGLPSGLIGGVGIHEWSSSGNTKLIDTTPEGLSNNNFSNSYLSDGRSFQDQINGITVTQLSHNSTSATVQITYGPAICVKAKPAVTASPLSQQATAGSLLKYNVVITNKDTPSCTSSTFNVSSNNLPSGFSYSGTSASINPGSSATLSLSVTSPSGFPDSSNIFVILGSDTNDASHSNNTQATYITFTDLTNPTVSITSPTDGSNLGKSTNVTIGVSATDNMGIEKVEIYVDGKLMVTDISSPYSYKWNTRNITTGSHIITAKAYDKSGNNSSASITVNK